MCGIFGFTGSHNLNPDNITKLFIANESRGGHATGYYSKEHGIRKHNVTAQVFLKLFPLPTEGNLFIGHTRFGTQGKNTPKNAHPFKIGKFIGAHNGMIQNDHLLAKEYNFKHKVDSEAIFQMLDKKGFEGLKEVHGAMAIAFTQPDKEGSLFLYRRDNPIYIGYTDERQMYFSSLEHVLRTFGCTAIGMLNPDIVFEFFNGQIVEKTPIEYTKPAGYTHRNWDDDFYGHDYNRGRVGYKNEYDDYYDGRLVYNPTSGVWERIPYYSTKKPAYTPDTIGSRKAASGAGKDRELVTAGQTANAFSKVDAEKNMKLLNSRVEEILSEQVEESEVDDMTELIDLLKDCYDYFRNRKSYSYDPDGDELEQKLQKLLY